MYMTSSNGWTSTVHTDSPMLYEVIPFYQENTYLIVQDGGKPVHAQENWHFMVTWEERSFHSASCWQIVAATREELKQVEIKKQNETTYKQIWADEFNVSGKFNEDDWTSEYGYVRNPGSAEWYQENNTKILEGGKLQIEGRREDFKNPWYKPGSTDWSYKNEWVNYTSGSISTIDKRDWLFGRFEVKAQIPVMSGAWPAIWFLGYQDTNGQWPSCGEIDLMEYYTGDTLANNFWASETGTAGDAILTPLSYWRDHYTGNWTNLFHVWRMDWDEEAIKLYWDDELINCMLVTRGENKSPASKVKYPFLTPQYLIINLAMGAFGGTIDDKTLPMHYYVEYVRVSQQERHIDGIKCHHCQK